MLIKIIEDYTVIVANLSKIIRISGYKNEFIANKMGIKPKTFSVKKHRANWTPDEVLKIVEVVKNKEVEDFFLTLTMQKN